MKRKNNKKTSINKKAVIASVAGLSAVALATVGFSSWIINAQAQTAEGNVTAEVGSVTDNRFDIAINGDDTAIKFDAPSSTAGSTQTARSDVVTIKDGGEDLACKFTLTVTRKDQTAFSAGTDVGDLKVTISDGATGSDSKDFASLLTDGYIALPDGFTLDSATTLTPGTTTGVDNAWLVQNGALKIAYTCTFKWGSKFGNVNPYYTPENTLNDDDLATALKTLATKTPKIKLTFSLAPKA